MIVWRAMGAEEFVKCQRGDIIRPPKNNLSRWKNGYSKREGLCFFFNANNAAHWSMGKYDIIACLDIPEERLEKSKGRYPDLTTWDLFKFVWIEECRTDWYQVGKNATLLGYGVIDFAKMKIHMKGKLPDQPLLPQYI